MSKNKLLLLKCSLRTLGCYACVSFAFAAFIALGIRNGNTGIGDFAKRVLVSDLAIFLASAVYGFSFWIFEAKNMSSTAKRFLHVLVNYIFVMLTAYCLFANVESEPSGWIVFLFFVTMVYFVVYGVAAAVSFLVKRAKR